MRLQRLIRNIMQTILLSTKPVQTIDFKKEYANQLRCSMTSVLRTSKQSLVGCLIYPHFNIRCTSLNENFIPQLTESGDKKP
jgi:hypothetical protein